VQERACRLLGSSREATCGRRAYLRPAAPSSRSGWRPACRPCLRTTTSPSLANLDHLPFGSSDHERLRASQRAAPGCPVVRDARARAHPAGLRRVSPPSASPATRRLRSLATLWRLAADPGPFEACMLTIAVALPVSPLPNLRPSLPIVRFACLPPSQHPGLDHPPALHPQLTSERPVADRL
jgi:hypothetical protein